MHYLDVKHLPFLLLLSFSSKIGQELAITRTTGTGCIRNKVLTVWKRKKMCKDYKTSAQKSSPYTLQEKFVSRNKKNLYQELSRFLVGCRIVEKVVVLLYYLSNLRTILSSSSVYINHTTIQYPLSCSTKEFFTDG